MKIEIETTPEAMEIGLFLLARAVETYSQNADLRESWKVTGKDLTAAQELHKTLLKAFLKKGLI